MDLFAEDFLIGLDPVQLAAATATEGRVLVRSGAGTGKTRTLVSRILHLVRDRNIPPHRIVAVTFTNKAAREIRERVASMLGDAVARRLIIGTFHSISARWLRRHFDESTPFTKGFRIIDQDDSARILKSVVLAYAPKPAGMNEEAYTHLVNAMAASAGSFIRTWKSNGIHWSVVDDPKRPRNRGTEQEAAAQIYVAYQKELRARDSLDFGDLVLEFVHLLDSNGDYGVGLSGGIEQLLVDEGQDANPCQVQWVRHLTHANRGLFVVGDEDQSIFSFQGGFPKAMVDMFGKPAREIELTVNRRCTDDILRPACKLVGWNRRQVPKKLVSGRSGAPVGVHRAGNEREEATRLAIHIRELMDSGVKAAEIAILYRSGWVSKPIEEALLRARVPYQIVGGTALLDREEARDILGYLRLALDPMNVTAFERISNRPPRGIGHMIEEAIMKFSRAGQLRLGEACLELSEIGGQRIVKGSNEGVLKLGSFLERLSLLYENSSTVTTRRFMDLICGPEGLDYEAFVRETNDKKTAKRRLDNIAILKRLADDEPDLMDFVEKLVLGEIGEEEVDRGAVRMSTMHSSKGLEWDYVFLPAFDEHVTPAPRAGTEAVISKDPWLGAAVGGLEEERRLVHVAMTRARTQMHVSFATSRNGRPQVQSVFLPEAGLEVPEARDEFDGALSGKKAGSKKGSLAGRKGYGSAMPF